MKVFLALVALFVSFTPLVASNATAEDSLDNHGPHAGYVSVSGSLISELLPRKEGFRLFLLTSNWGPRSLEGLSLKGSFADGKACECKGGGEAFDCVLPKGSDLSGAKEKNLNFEIKEKGKVLGKIIYPLPLQHLQSTSHTK